MTDQREKMREAIARFHRNSCYPDAVEVELDNLIDELTALSAGETKEDDRPLSDAEIRAGINILLETIAKKFEAYDTLDIWRSDAADIVRSYKHSFSGETKSDGGAEVASSAAPATRGEQRDRTHGTMPVGGNAENSARTDRSPSDPIPSPSAPPLSAPVRRLKGGCDG